MTFHPTTFFQITFDQMTFDKTLAFTVFALCKSTRIIKYNFLHHMQESLL